MVPFARNVSLGRLAMPGSGLCNRIVTVPLPRGISEISNRNFCWKESTPNFVTHGAPLQTHYWGILGGERSRSWKLYERSSPTGTVFFPPSFRRPEDVSKYQVLKYASRKIMNFFLPPPLHLYNKFICFTSIVDGPFRLPSVTYNQAKTNVWVLETKKCRYSKNTRLRTCVIPS